MKLPSSAVLVALTFAPAIAAASPPLSAAGLEDWRTYRQALPAKAFAIAPGGAWGWSAAQADRETALAEALARCQAATRQRCLPYAIDERIVFDAAAWNAAWRAEPRRGATLRTGTDLGERFPDLAFTDPQGRRSRLSALRGQIVLLHFWASWCGPCRHELPELQKLYDALRDRPDIAFVLLQVREPIEAARRFAAAQGLTLPLADSGVRSADEGELRLADGRRVADRTLASRFPSSYVLDREGRVLFHQAGVVPAWAEYASLLRTTANHRRKHNSR